MNITILFIINDVLLTLLYVICQLHYTCFAFWRSHNWIKLISDYKLPASEISGNIALNHPKIFIKLFQKIQIIFTSNFEISSLILGKGNRR